jgi:cyanophycin synthetase
MLRTRPRRSTFFAGRRRLQSDVVALARPEVTEKQCALLARELGQEAPPSPDLAVRFFELVIGAHAALLREAGFFFPEGAELIDVGDGSGLAVAIPKIPSGTDISAELFQRLIRLCLQSALQGTPASEWLGKLRQEVAKVPPPFLAAAHMVRAAYELGMPILEWHSVFVQVGYGKNAVALTGSITQETSSIGVHFAREKAKANMLLARAGFPIAEGGLVRDLADARAQAEALGYPVVVKPADKDGGDAVSSDIRDSAELEQAFERARAASRHVIVEKHIPGTDYRLLLYHDELLVALERTPGCVTGNGKDSVARLLERENREPHRLNGLLYPIEFDDEARLMLARQGLTADSVPAKGQFVSLRRAANHALGGRVRKIEDMHPDNVDLARRAMRLLRLDLAGLDLILPDATRSWREAGGAICEVNAQPYIGEVYIRDVYKDILQQLVPEGGRIPLVLVVGTLDAKTVAGLAAKVPGLAVIDADGARRDGHPLSVAGMAWPLACQAALYDNQTAAALCVLDPSGPVPPISPADRFSAAFVLDALRAGAETLLRRADTIYALDPPRRKGLKFKQLQKTELAKTLAAALAGKPIGPAAKPKPAPRGKAPPAPRKRR